jgi:alkylation response protein AidB-like acyl-CoA dehydrogenase
MLFVLRHVIGEDRLKTLPGQDGLPDLLEPVLLEAAKLAEGVLAPLNTVGDRKSATWKAGEVATAPGWKDAYKAYCDGGWNAVPFTPDFGGQGLPWSIAFPVQEMWQAANMAFGLCPLLNQGAVEAIAHHGSAEQKAFYLPKLISGEWTGTMNLTEPQAGSDLAAVRAKADRNGDGTYKVTGQKIFITYGEHDLAPNIIHLVLARLPDAPAGVKGISLFIVPKFLADGKRNDVTCASIEHKLGIHGSPTCTMAFGDKGGATAYLVGKEHEGIKYMFTMMNNARFSVGLQGVAISDRALQKAIHYAKDRVQGGGKAIIEHADVKRMILTMQAYTEAGRMMAYDAAYQLDSKNTARVELLTPIVKGWCTDRSVDVASLGVQIHGGMGFIEETGAAQFYRDARILPIYEGTNGIQALDLVGRKIMRDEGAAMNAWVDEQKMLLSALESAHGMDLSVIGETLQDGFETLRGSTGAIVAMGKNNQMEAAGSVAHPYLTLCGHVMAGTMLARSALAARQMFRDGHAATGYSPQWLQSKITLARFFADHILPQVTGLSRTVRQGAESVVTATL